MHGRTKRLGFGIATAVVFAFGSAPMAAASTGEDSAPTFEHVNLGDSFSAGSGVLPLVPGVPEDCSQSELNFAHIVAREQGYSLSDVSCGGAATKDFYAPQIDGVQAQLDALSPSTDLVTLMIGGNDNNIFADAIASCVGAAVKQFGVANPCEQNNGHRFDDTITDITLPDVRQALADIHTRAPEAKVVIVGYPWLLPAAHTCAPSIPVAPGDAPFVRALQTTLNDAIRQAAEDTDTTFVDMSAASEGHDACQPVGVRWVEPLFFAQHRAPLHPNALGTAAIAAEVTKALASS